MKSIVSLVLIGATILCLSGQTLAIVLKDCQNTAKLKSVCLMEVEDLHPTQFSVGSVAVECKKKKIEKKYEKDKLEKYLASESRHVPAAVGPDGKFYITDRHHLTTAVYRAKESDWRGKKQKVYVTIIANFHGTGISMEEFWNIMAMQKYVWPYDGEGKIVSDFGDKLPEMDMGDLKDNPYRTLSRWTRESCGYIKKGKGQCLALKATDEEPADSYFLEFHWAKFLRAQLEKLNSELDSPKKLMDSYFEAIQATLSIENTERFFEDQGLDAENYGQNQKGAYLHLEFNKNGCEEWYLEKD